MEKIKVNVEWTENNFAAVAFGNNINGSIVVTNKDLDQLKEDFIEALEFHIEGSVKDGDKLPNWVVNKQYELEFVLETSALLRDAEKYTSLAAISRASGLNQKQLSHYANGRIKPREDQRKRIITGLHKIGNKFINVV
jgi:hypothetical protein